MFLDRLDESVGMFDISCAPVKLKMLLHVWIGQKRNPVLVEDELRKVDRFCT